MNNYQNPADQLQELLEELLPPDKVYQPAVPPEQQRLLLEKVNENISNESFFFVFNLQKCCIENAAGVEKWLGYSSRDFTVAKYLSIIHNAQALQHNMLAHSMYKILCSGKFRLHFSTQRYISFIALKPYNDEYILFKKTTSVFQYDHNNKLLAQLNVFDKIDYYENSPLKPRITELSGTQRVDFEKMVFKMTLEYFMAGKFFSPAEFAVLGYHVQPDGLTAKQIADKMGIDIKTVHTYNKRILEKARRTFSQNFSNAKEVGYYLQKEKIL